MMRRTLYRCAASAAILCIALASGACLAVFEETAQAPIPFKSEAPADIGTAKIFIGFGIAILALGLSLYFLRRRLGQDAGATPSAKQLRVIETKRLTARSTLFVVEFSGTRYLIAESGHGVRCVISAPAPMSAQAGQPE